ncbi:hypothetical protein IT575_12840 [bacterium]|nr:hypothetical protein [bacterium]
MRRRPILTLLLALALASTAGLLSAQFLNLQRKRLLREGLGQIQLALERYAVDSEGSYPPDLKVLLERGYLPSMPRNPYSGAKMQVLAVTDPPSPGNLVYVSCGPIIALGNESNLDTDILPVEADQYLLAAYGPLSARQRAAFGAQLSAWQTRLGGARSSRYLAVLAGHPVHMPVRQTQSGEQLDYRDLVPAWGLFAVRLTAGEDANAQ